MGKLNEIPHLKSTFLPGAELWVVPMASDNTWFKKLNWYSSSQLSVWFYKRKPTFSEPLKRILNEEKLPFKSDLTHNFHSTLVHTAQIFPSKGLLAIDLSIGLETWFKELKQQAETLKINSIRIFWGQTQLEEFLKVLMAEQKNFASYSLEVVTCEPDPL